MHNTAPCYVLFHKKDTTFLEKFFSQNRTLPPPRRGGGVSPFFFVSQRKLLLNNKKTRQNLLQIGPIFPRGPHPWSKLDLFVKGQKEPPSTYVQFQYFAKGYKTPEKKFSDRGSIFVLAGEVLHVSPFLIISSVN